jgi:hypothetical protein
VAPLTAIFAISVTFPHNLLVITYYRNIVSYNQNRRSYNKTVEIIRSADDQDRRVIITFMETRPSTIIQSLRNHERCNGKQYSLCAKSYNGTDSHGFVHSLARILVERCMTTDSAYYEVLYWW